MSNVYVRKVWAPWNDDQLDFLRRWQAGELPVHAYTCGSDGHDGNPVETLLVPTRMGWACSDVHCQYRQLWYLA